VIIPLIRSKTTATQQQQLQAIITTTGRKAMKKGDTVRIRKTDMVGAVTEVHTNSGRHYSVKFDDLPEIVLYEDEIELIPNIDSTLIGCIKQSYGDAL
jgi:hypothetical protein